VKKLALPIFKVHVPSIWGVPFPDEGFESFELDDPQELRDRLDVQAVAGSVLPFIDTRARHWRYYLFAAPPSGSGHPIEVRRRLLCVLDQTRDHRAGIGRTQLKGFEDDGRRSEKKFLDDLEGGFWTAYRSATEAFWGTDSESAFKAPSRALCQAARAYVLGEQFESFFDQASAPDQLRHMFRARLIGLRKNLAEHIIYCKYDLTNAAMKAATAKGLSDSERMLFCSWALLRAYFSIADDGQVDDVNDDDDDDVASDSNDEYRKLANASIALLDRLGTPGKLTDKQIKVICERLNHAVKQKGNYVAPRDVWRLKYDGRRRRVFASLRLYAYRRLLLMTQGPR